MTLTAALGEATSGIAAIDRQLAVVSQNVANAGVAGYATEQVPVSSATVGGQGLGVTVGPTIRATDAVLTASLLAQTATASAATTRSGALSIVDAASGTPGAGTDLPSLLAKVTDAFTTLADTPSDTTAQQQVVTAAQALTQGINTLANTYATQRQAAENAVVTNVATLNTTLDQVGALSLQIVQLRAEGEGTADLENQRDAAVESLAQVVNVRAIDQPNGDVTLVGDGGLVLSTHGVPFATAPATLSANQTYPAAVTLDGVDVTRQIVGGSLGANLALRDQTFPAYQAALDETSYQLTSRFAAQGLTLFTRPDGTTPTASTAPTPVQTTYVGYANEIAVNPTVVANPATVRDGTNTIAGSATGASAFAVNPPGGPADFPTLARRVLDYALGSQVQDGVAQPATPTTGLGPAGAQSLPFSPPADIGGLLSATIAAQSADAGAAATDQTTQTGLRSTLSSKLGNEVGVSVDTELTTLTQLQNAYAANAKILTAIQTAWSDLLAAVGTVAP